MEIKYYIYSPKIIPGNILKERTFSIKIGCLEILYTVTFVFRPVYGQVPTQQCEEFGELDR